MFSPESKIFLWIKPKKKKKLFCGKFGSIPTSRSTRKGKKCFLWWAYVYLNTKCYKTSHLHQVFLRFRSDFLAFFATQSVTKHRIFIKFFCDFAQIFSLFSNVCRWLFTISYPTRAHGIIVNYEVVGSVRFLSCVCVIVAAILELIANTTECTPASGFWSIWTCSGRVTR